MHGVEFIYVSICFMYFSEKGAIMVFFAWEITYATCLDRRGALFSPHLPSFWPKLPSSLVVLQPIS